MHEALDINCTVAGQVALLKDPSRVWPMILPISAGIAKSKVVRNVLALSRLVWVITFYHIGCATT